MKMRSYLYLDNSVLCIASLFKNPFGKFLNQELGNETPSVPNKEAIMVFVSQCSAQTKVADFDKKIPPVCCQNKLT